MSKTDSTAPLDWTHLGHRKSHLPSGCLVIFVFSCSRNLVLFPLGHGTTGGKKRLVVPTHGSFGSYLNFHEWLGHFLGVWFFSLYYNHSIVEGFWVEIRSTRIYYNIIVADAIQIDHLRLFFLVGDIADASIRAFTQFLWTPSYHKVLFPTPFWSHCLKKTYHTVVQGKL
jgi:hypothetical protein